MHILTDLLIAHNSAGECEVICNCTNGEKLVKTGQFKWRPMYQNFSVTFKAPNNLEIVSTEFRVGGELLSFSKWPTSINLWKGDSFSITSSQEIIIRRK